MAVLALLASAYACGSSSTAPSEANISGTWSGPIVDNIAGGGTFRLTVVQTTHSLSGSWATTYANPSTDTAGQATGTKNGSEVSISATPSNPVWCAYIANLTLTSATTMTGAYAAFTCTRPLSGTLTRTKQ